MPDRPTTSPMPDPRRVPYYTPCLFAVAYEKLRAEGCQLFDLSLLSNLQLLSIATYTPAHAASAPQVSIWKARRLLGYGRWFEHMGVCEVPIEYPDAPSGFDALRASLAAGRAAIVSGATYFLPYSPDYQNARYLADYPNPLFGVSNHWLLVYALDGEEAVVFDPIPHQYAGPVSLASFACFWEGNRSIPELAHVPGIAKLRRFGCLDLHYDQPISEVQAADLAVRALLTGAREYLRETSALDDGAPCYCGGRADYALLADLPVHMLEAAARPAYATCVFEMVFSRYMFRDLLRALAAARSGPFQGWAQAYQQVVSAWEQAGRLLKLYIARGALTAPLVGSVVDSLAAAVEAEHAVHQEICRTYADQTPLVRRDQAA